MLLSEIEYLTVLAFSWGFLGLGRYSSRVESWFLAHCFGFPYTLDVHAGIVQQHEPRVNIFVFWLRSGQLDHGLLSARDRLEAWREIQRPMLILQNSLKCGTRLVR